MQKHVLNFLSPHLIPSPSKTCLSRKVAFSLPTLEVLVRRSDGEMRRTRLTLDLDTSCILAWLIEEGYEVIAFMADVGQEEVCTRCLCAWI